MNTYEINYHTYKIPIKVQIRRTPRLKGFIHDIASIEYENILITQKHRTKYLKFYVGYMSTHINYCKENDIIISKEFPVKKWRRLEYLNDKHIELLKYIVVKSKLKTTCHVSNHTIKIPDKYLL